MIKALGEKKKLSLASSYLALLPSKYDGAVLAEHTVTAEQEGVEIGKSSFCVGASGPA